MASEGPPEGAKSSVKLESQKHTGEPPLVSGVGTAPTIFTDGLKGIQVRDGTVKLNFVEHVMDHDEGQMKARVVCNIVMSNKSMKRLVEVLTKPDIQQSIDEARDDG